MTIIKFFQSPALEATETLSKLRKIRGVCPKVTSLDTESCYYVEIQNEVSLTTDQSVILKNILGRPEDRQSLSSFNQLNGNVIEIGPRLNFSTSFSTNAVSVCRAVGLDFVNRIEKSVRYLPITCQQLEKDDEEAITNCLSDRMTQTRYFQPLTSFDHGVTPEPWYFVDILNEGKSALEKVNADLGLGLDSWDVDYYYHLFTKQLKRNPTNVECFDLAQSNSEHSRHWFFKGRLIIDGRERNESLMDLITSTQKYTNNNNVIKFADNSSAIQGFSSQVILPSRPGEPCQLVIKNQLRHITFTAETHNFPTGVSPFSGATTGTGGRIRDNQAVGRGGHVVAATVGYSFGQLLIPGYNLPWENADLAYPSNLARPLQVAIEASDGASDYGNKFGEPVICGFARSFGLVVPDGSRREWIKPIMFSGGIGQVDEGLVRKMRPEIGMEVVKIGGPAYRIGLGGGAASSRHIQGDNPSDLDFGAVQRGDAEMEQKMNRLLRACIECIDPDHNPICSIHDQGAGGNGNVLKEIVDPLGAVIYADRFQLGDASLSTTELWGAEYQESNALLCKSSSIEMLRKMARRERCPIAFVGRITGNGRVILCESAGTEAPHPVDLPLEQVLEHMPRKIFHLKSQTPQNWPLSLDNISVDEALERVLRLPSVASKRYLTNKVDRSVGGLVAQQQCVGPLHTPLADVAVVASSYFDHTGSATALGEQPIKGLVSAAAGARMSVAESLLNLVWAPITCLRDVKCSCNWMWAAKVEGEGASLVQACTALCSTLARLGVAVDGGKDSLSMAVQMASQVIKAPGTVVVSTYAPCTDIRLVVTPDFKLPAAGRRGSILLVDLSGGYSRLGGSALAQSFQQIGNSAPDLEDPEQLAKAFGVTQELIKDNLIVSGHDISDGGLITCILEMAFAGVCGFQVDLSTISRSRQGDLVSTLFCEELGFVLEVDPEHEALVLERFNNRSIPSFKIGCTFQSRADAQVQVRINGEIVMEGSRSHYLKMWEETSYQLDRLQADQHCVDEEFDNILHRNGPEYQLSFDPDAPLPRGPTQKPKVAIIREEGTNGDREMAAALLASGFDVWDINTQDLIDGTSTLDAFRGLVFPGGFSFGDVLGSAKGWAASMMYIPSIHEQLERFKRRPETFTLGVCNGCQLMALMGWIDPYIPQEGTTFQVSPAVYLDHNQSGRYESRFCTVRIEKSHAILLRGMSGSRLGVWVSHAEGRFKFRDLSLLDHLENSGCVALRYVDDCGQPCSSYPMNPNGSVHAIAGICSSDGRHLALMPHPERCVWNWQLAWKPPTWKHFQSSPWRKMFDNAFLWSCELIE